MKLLKNGHTSKADYRQQKEKLVLLFFKRKNFSDFDFSYFFLLNSQNEFSLSKLRSVNCYLKMYILKLIPLSLYQKLILNTVF